jgi:5-methyltetrahydrofolate--homocysteine methyltransferase
MEAINIEAAKIAKKICPAGKFVAGDIGPTGKMLEPLGDVTVEELTDSFRAQGEALLKGGADFISIETLFSLEEALSAVKGVKQLGDVLVSVSMTYNKTKNGFFTMMGESVTQCVTAFEDAGAEIIASNCTLGSAEMIELTQVLRDATSKPILVQPNAGKPVTRKGVTHYEQTPSEFAEDAKKMIASGANMIGGCCGTNPQFIQRLKEIL